MAQRGADELLTVGEVLNRAMGFFKRCRVDNPRLDAEVLLSHVLGLDRIELYVHYDRPLDGEERDRYRKLVARRANRQPVAYLTGEREFMSLRFFVDEAVLIPRPETELLVEMVLDEIKGRCGAGTGLSVLELGTGSGAVAVSVAYFARREGFPLRGIWATDISRRALDVARRNARHHDLREDVHFLAGDLFAALEGEKGEEEDMGEGEKGEEEDMGEGDGVPREFEIICSNPPYIPRDAMDGLQPEISAFEPRRALEGGEDGLDFYCRIAADAGGWLSARGRLFLEIGADQGSDVRQILTGRGFSVREVREDHSGRERVVVAEPRGAAHRPHSPP